MKALQLKLFSRQTHNSEFNLKKYEREGKQYKIVCIELTQEILSLMSGIFRELIKSFILINVRKDQQTNQ